MEIRLPWSFWELPNSLLGLGQRMVPLALSFLDLSLKLWKKGCSVKGNGCVMTHTCKHGGTMNMHEPVRHIVVTGNERRSLSLLCTWRTGVN